MKNQKKRLISLALVVVFVMALAMTGCGSSNTADTSKQSSQQTTQTAQKTEVPATGTQGGKVFQGSPDELYSQVQFVTGVEYWFPVYEMFKQAGRQLGVKTHYDGCPEYEASKEVAAFEQVVAQKPKGIFLSPINPDVFVAPINAAVDKGIAVVTFASDSPNSKRMGYITSDNVREGQYCADAMGKDMGGKGKVAVLENPGQDNHDKRIKSFLDEIKAKFPDIQVVNRAASNQDAQKAYQATLAFLQKDPDLGGIFMPEATSMMGAAQAVVEKKANCRILGCDVNAKVLDMIKAGEIWGALNPDQGQQGYFGMLMLFTAAHPELIDPMTGYKAEKTNPVRIPVIDNNLTIVNKSNADYFYWDKYVKGRNSKGIEE